MACGRPDERGVGAVGIVAVGVSPGVDEVRVSAGGATDHSGFRLKVAFSGWWSIVLVSAKEIGEENLACGGVCSWGEARGWADVCVNRVGIVIGKIAIAGGLEGGDFSFRGGGGAVPANRACGTEGKACENADNGDDSEEFDQGEGSPASLSLGKPC